MAVRQRRYSKEELARRGQELYESGIRQQIEAGNDGKIVAIGIETGDFEVDETVMAATDRLFRFFIKRFLPSLQSIAALIAIAKSLGFL